MVEIARTAITSNSATPSKPAAVNAVTSPGSTPSFRAIVEWKATAQAQRFATALDSSSTCRSPPVNLVPPNCPNTATKEFTSVCAAAPRTNSL